MNAPLYTIEILRLAASLPDPRDARAGRRQRARALADLRQHGRDRGPARPTAGSRRCRSRSRPAPSARPRRRWSPSTQSAGRSEEVEAALTDLSDWLAGEQRRSGRLARARRPRAGALAEVAPRRDPAAVPGAAGGDRMRRSDNARRDRRSRHRSSSKAARSCSARRWCSSPSSASSSSARRSAISSAARSSGPMCSA